MLSKLVRNNPSNSLTLDICLIVDTLDREENFAQAARLHDICLELCNKLLAVLDNSSLDFVISRHVGKEEEHRKGVVKIT